MKKVGLGVIGAGGVISKFHADAYLTCDRVSVVAVCEPHEEKAKEASRQWGAQRYYTNYTDLLKDDDVDAVEILTPHHLHCEMVVAAANAGKHVSVQKPMAMTIREADEMIRAARNTGVKLSVFENYIFYPPIAKTKELIEAGDIGTPTTIRMEVIGGAQECDKFMTSEAIEWRSDKKKSGGGIVFDGGHHQFSVARLLMGDIEKVHALIDKPENHLETTAAVMWSHTEKGRFGSLDMIISPKLYVRTRLFANYETFEVIGTEGAIWVSCGPGELLGAPKTVLYKDGDTTNFGKLDDDWTDGFVGAVHDFVDCILLDRKPKFSGEDGRKNIQVALAAYKSAEEEKAIRPTEIL